MGNEGSHLSGLVIEDKATDITDFWSQHQAKIDQSCRYFSLKCDGSVSVFRGEIASGPLWTVSSPIEKFSNNLLKFRHPCIVRYLSSWQRKSLFHLATEFVQPLNHVLAKQTPLQICIGLNNILRALVFLHEQALMSHNNVSIFAVYVTGDNQWKLGGLQFLCPFSDLTPTYMKQARMHRYDKAVDPNEDSLECIKTIDQYAFAVLVEDALKGHSDDAVPHLKDFKSYCRNCLQHSDPIQRAKLTDVLQHNFFNHQFISIYKFLNFLPLKSEDEKAKFFSNITENLKCYDEDTVARELGGLLLSRLTLLDPTARKHVVPHILKPNNEASESPQCMLYNCALEVVKNCSTSLLRPVGRMQNSDIQGLFSVTVFKEHVKPRLMQLFGVRDIQIRILLLTHFSKYVHVFTHDELSQHILPELLLGIKDTDDNLVSSTLICLSELVPILGSQTVIGGKRLKLFTDGRPTSMSKTISSNSETYSTSKISQDFLCSQALYSCNNGDTNDYVTAITLNERPSPVGGESGDDVLKENKIINNLIESEEDWSDWENSNQQLVIESLCDTITIEEKNINKIANKIGDFNLIKDVLPGGSNVSLLQKAAIAAKKNIVDISELDIKNQKNQNNSKNEDIDFFADMMPVLEKPAVLSVNEEDVTSKLKFVPVEDDAIADWGDSWDE